MYNDFNKPSENMMISDREASRMFYESQQEYFKKQQEAEDRQSIAIQNQINEQNDYFLNREIEADNYINKRISFIESVKNSLLSECLMKIYKDSSVAPLTESDKVIVNKLINNFIIENGADNLLDNFATKNLLLSEVNRITCKYYNAIIEKCDECNDDKGKEFIIDKTIKDEFLEELKDLDTIDVSKLIKDRVADAITEFINSNEDQKYQYQELINAAKDNMAKTTNEALITDYSNIATRMINEMKNERVKNVFHYMVESLSKKSLCDDTLKARYVNEASLDMDSVVNDCMLIYNMLEMVNTTNMVNVDYKYMCDYINSLS